MALDIPRAIVASVACVVLTVSLIGCGGGGKPTSDQTHATLANGVSMPLLAAGTWQYNDTIAESTVVEALKAGFKHIDTAHDYENQVGVGKGLNASGKKREDVFVTSKVPGCGLQGIGKEDCENNTYKAIKEDLQLIGQHYDIKYLDLLLIHFPPCVSEPTDTGKGSPSKSTCGGKKLNGCTDPDNCKAIALQWKAVERAYKEGLVKAVGVSNYCSKCFGCLGDNVTVKPMVNQVQFHVGMTPDPQGFASFAKKNNMLLQAWSPLGSGGHGDDEILKGNLTSGIANAHQKSTAQIALKWLIQHGFSVATKSSNPKHLAEDIDLFHFDLTEEEMSSLDAASFHKTDNPSFLCLDAQSEELEMTVIA